MSGKNILLVSHKSCQRGHRCYCSYTDVHPPDVRSIPCHLARLATALHPDWLRCVSKVFLLNASGEEVASELTPFAPLEARNNHIVPTLPDLYM